MTLHANSNKLQTHPILHNSEPKVKLNLKIRLVLRTLFFNILSNTYYSEKSIWVIPQYVVSIFKVWVVLTCALLAHVKKSKKRNISLNLVHSIH